MSMGVFVNLALQFYLKIIAPTIAGYLFFFVPDAFFAFEPVDAFVCSVDWAAADAFKPARSLSARSRSLAASGLVTCASFG